MESLAQDPWLRSILELSARTKDLCTQTAELLAVDARGESSAEAAQKQAKLIKTVRAQLSQIRGAHREVALSSRRTKQVTADAKVEVDKLHLSLSNLSYEERHLREEIMNCESYE